jgi:putative flippase GtrA
MTRSFASRFGRVNPIVPAMTILVGAALYVSGRSAVGGGVAIGAVLALVNGFILSKRVEFAATTGDVAQALMVMQIGLLVTFTVIGAATIVLIHFSLALTIACACGFVASQLGILATFYWTHARTMPPVELKATPERNPL